MLCLGIASKFTWLKKKQADAKSFHDACFIILQFLKKDMKGENMETKNSSSQPTKCAVSPGQLHGSPETGGPCEICEVRW